MLGRDKTRDGIGMLGVLMISVLVLITSTVGYLLVKDYMETFDEETNRRYSKILLGSICVVYFIVFKVLLLKVYYFTNTS